MFHQKTFGAESPKPTAVLTNCQDPAPFTMTGWPVLADDGSYLGPLPNIRGKPMAMGSDNTKSTAAYPPLLCQALAIKLTSDGDLQNELIKMLEGDDEEE